MDEFLYGCDSAAIATVLATAMLAALELGYRLGAARARTASEALRAHVNSVQASLLGLLALIIGFTFSVALQHFDARSIAVVSEANAIGTTWLRSEMLNPDSRAAVRVLLRRYVDTRIDDSRLTLPDTEQHARLLAHSEQLLAELWQAAAQAVAKDPRPVTSGLFVQTLNDSIDALASRNAALNRHVPEIVLWILFATFAVTAAVLGYSAGIAAHRPPLASALLIALIALVTYLIVDLDRPRRGLILVSQAPLVELQKSMGEVRAPPPH